MAVAEIGTDVNHEAECNKCPSLLPTATYSNDK